MAGRLQGLLRGAMGMVLACGSLGACRSIVPLDRSTRFGDRLASELVLVLREPCSLLPGGTPMGRPDGVSSHTLPGGRYRPALQDEGGIYFASPGGISVMEPEPRGTRTLAGGVYVAHAHSGAWEYLGDASGISSRQPLPGHCSYQIEPGAAPAEVESPAPAERLPAGRPDAAPPSSSP